VSQSFHLVVLLISFINNMDTHKLPFFRTVTGIALMLVIVLIAGFFGGMEYKAYQVRSAIAQALGQTANTVQNTPTQAGQNTVSTATGIYIDKAISDEISFATFDVKV